MWQKDGEFARVEDRFIVEREVKGSGNLCRIDGTYVLRPLWRYLQSLKVQSDNFINIEVQDSNNCIECLKGAVDLLGWLSHQEQ